MKGIIPALVTPSDEQGGLALETIPPLIEFLLKRRIGGFFVGGSTGEGFFLNLEERKLLAEAVTRETAGRVPVVIHVASMNFREVTQLSSHAQTVGADAVSSVLPFYYKYGLREIHDYYQAIAAAAHLPTIIYALNPSGTSTFPPQDFINTVRSVDGIYGIKFSNPDISLMQYLKQLSQCKLAFFGGCDELPLPMLIMGASGLIGSNYNALPEIWVAIHDAFIEREFELAKVMQNRITYYMRKLQKIPPISRAKGLLKLRGFDVGEARFPLASLTSTEQGLLEETFSELQNDPVFAGCIQ